MLSKTITLTGAIAFAVALCFLSTVPASAQGLVALQENVLLLEAELEQAQMDLSTTQQDLEAAEAALAAAEAELDTAQSELDALEAALAAEVAARAQLQIDVVQLALEAADLQDQIDELVEAMNPTKKVFATSQVFTGDLVAEAASLAPGAPATGLAAGDFICNTVASGAGLVGSFKAWLSDDTNSPLTRFAQAAGPYTLPTGEVVADDWNDLVDGVGDIIIDRDASGDQVDFSITNAAATGTQSDGDNIPGHNCSEWTDNVDNGTGFSDSNVVVGLIGAPTGFWTNAGTNGPFCNFQGHLYCFEQ